jgi:putative flippase GtrA
MIKKNVNRLRLSREFQYYVTIGVTAFICEYVTFLFIFTVTTNLMLGQSLSFMAGLLTSFTGNRKLTFKTRIQYASGPIVQLQQYIALALVNLVLSNILIHVLVDYMPATIAKLIVMVTFSLWNYAIFRRFIFRSV